MPPVKASARGQALIEFALVLPLLCLLIFNLVNFGTFIYAWITVANAARAGAQYMIMGGAWVGSPSPPNPGAVITLATNDAQWLPNAASLKVRMCTKNGAAAAVCAGTVPSPSPPWVTQVEIDPESGLYVGGWVDVAYTYQPLIPLWDFPNLGIHLTLPATTIHRRAVMRMVQ